MKTGRFIRSMIEQKTIGVIDTIAQIEKRPLDESTIFFEASSTYNHLQNPETRLYEKSTDKIYEYYNQEQNNELGLPTHKKQLILH